MQEKEAEAEAAAGLSAKDVANPVMKKALRLVRSCTRAAARRDKEQQKLLAIRRGAKTEADLASARVITKRRAVPPKHLKEAPYKRGYPLLSKDGKQLDDFKLEELLEAEERDEAAAATPKNLCLRDDANASGATPPSDLIIGFETCGVSSRRRRTCLGSGEIRRVIFLYSILTLPFVPQ